MGKKKELKKKEREEEQYMVKNGGIVLEELISTGNGKYNPIRNFSAKQLLEATNNFHSPCFDVEYVKWFKACLNNRPVLISKFNILIRKFNNLDEFVKTACRDIAISSQMSSHNRVLKLLGCCLEFPVPVLVYEDAENGPLNHCGGIGRSSLPWRTRLKIAKDIANALTYLHTAFSRPIIHRDVHPSNVLLNKDFIPKLCNFSDSISIPEGETHVEDPPDEDAVVHGTLGYLDPEYFRTSSFTEKTDVYSFGVFLLVLISGKPALDMHSSPRNLVLFAQEKQWNEIVDSKILEEEGVDTEKQKLQDFLNLALKCTQSKGENRPMMIDVAKELARIHRSTTAP